jgi:oxalate decarboxylase/phosphoglucose isomerase-like protein (cupin superfamily)
MMMRTPLMLRDGPSDNWDALKVATHWNPQHISEHVSNFNNVRTSSQHVFTYNRIDNAASIAGSQDSVDTQYTVEYVNMSSAEFISGLKSEEQSHYYTADLDSTPEFSTIRSQIGAADEFYKTMSSLTGKRAIQTVWIGSTGVVSSLHYDAVHNFFVQTAGVKRAVLFPPSLHRSLRMHPHTHPLSRQSQIRNLSAIEHITELRQPISVGASADSIEAYEVILQAGDVLYIPPYYMHYMEALTPSVSVSTWLEAEESFWTARAHAIPIPLGKGSKTKKFRKLASFLESFWYVISDGLASLRDRQLHHLERPDVKAADDGVYSEASLSLEDRLELVKHVKSTKILTCSKWMELVRRRYDSVAAQCGDFEPESGSMKAAKVTQCVVKDDKENSTTRIATAAQDAALEILRVPADAMPSAEQKDKTAGVAEDERDPLQGKNIPSPHKLFGRNSPYVRRLTKWMDANVVGIVEMQILDYVDRVIQSVAKDLCHARAFVDAYASTCCVTDEATARL